MRDVLFCRANKREQVFVFFKEKGKTPSTIKVCIVSCLFSNCCCAFFKSIFYFFHYQPVETFKNTLSIENFSFFFLSKELRLLKLSKSSYNQIINENRRVYHRCVFFFWILCRQFEFWYEVFYISSSIKHVFYLVEGRKMTDITN